MRFIVSIAALMVLAGCSKSDTASTTDTAAQSTLDAVQSAPQSAGAPVSLTAADIDGFIKGIEREAYLVRDGQARASAAVTPVERGNAIQSTFEENTMKGATEASGLSLDRYRMVRQTLSRLMTTLDFQGKIDGPQSVDTAHADAEMKARLSSDPYASLDVSSAELVKSRLDAIVKAWLDYINLTAVNG